MTNATTFAVTLWHHPKVRYFSEEMGQICKAAEQQSRVNVKLCNADKNAKIEIVQGIAKVRFA